MNLGDYLIWEATNGLLLIPTVIVLVMLVRRFRGRPVFSEPKSLRLVSPSLHAIIKYLLFATDAGKGGLTLALV
jgi:hypothetical protein